MKKIQLRKLIREVLSEQLQQYMLPGATTMCTPSPTCVVPELSEFMGAIRVQCPSGFYLQHGANVSGLVSGGAQGPDAHGIMMSRCIPNIGSPGDMAGHGSPDDPFVPGMGFEDQFIDQITGPDGPWGKGSIKESKKRRK